MGPAWQFRTTCGACRGLLLRGHIHRAPGQHGGETAKDVPAIFLQGIGRISGRAKSSTGTSLASWDGTLFARRSLRCAAVAALLQYSFAGDLEGEGLSYACVGSNLHHGV